MRPRGAAVAEITAATMGGTAADRVGKFERQSLRRVVPDGRADAADAGIREPEAVGATKTVSCSAKAGHPVSRGLSVSKDGLWNTGSPDQGRAMTPLCGMDTPSHSIPDRTSKSHPTHDNFSCPTRLHFLRRII